MNHEQLRLSIEQKTDSVWETSTSEIEAKTHSKIHLYILGSNVGSCRCLDFFCKEKKNGFSQQGLKFVQCVYIFSKYYMTI